MKVIIIGASGLLGSHLSVGLSELGYDTISTFHETNLQIRGCRSKRLDLLDTDDVRKLLNDESPDYIIQCSAMTSIELCELQKDKSDALNVDAVSFLSKLCCEMGIRLIYISTPTVFGNNTGGKRLVEDDDKKPLNYYSKCKSNAEGIVLRGHMNSVVRLNPFGHAPSGSFILDWSLKNAMLNSNIVGFTDCSFNPIFAGNIAKYLHVIMSECLAGVFHLGCNDEITKFDFVKSVAKVHGINFSIIAKTIDELYCENSDLPSVVRNKYNVISLIRSEKKLDIPFQNFKNELNDFIKFKDSGGYAKMRRVYNVSEIIDKTWVVIPAKDEENTISKVLSALGTTFKNIIVVDDGSLDSTSRSACFHETKPHVVYCTTNRGYDAALQQGFLYAIKQDAEFVLTFDADGQHRVSDARKMIKLATNCDMVLGIRDRKPRITEHLFSWILRLVGISDPLCGMKLYRTKLFRHATFFDRFDSIGTDLLIHSIILGYNYKQVNISVRDREDNSRFGRKLITNMKIANAIRKVVLRYWRGIW